MTSASLHKVGPVDLHTHSLFSDGMFTPTQIVAMAVKSKLQALALTDHDNVAGLDEFVTACQASNIVAVPGVEISCNFNGQKAHILGLFLKEWKNFSIHLHQLQRGRIIRFEKMLEKTNSYFKLNLTMADVDLAPAAVPARPHLARLLVKLGLVDSFSLAFRRYLGDNCPLFVACNRIDVQTAVKLIHNAGGLAGLAHPGIDNHISNIPAFAQVGVDAVEAHSRTHTPEQVKRCLDYCKRYGLLPCGGSDFHDQGENFEIGKPYVDIDVYECLRQKALTIAPH